MIKTLTVTLFFTFLSVVVCVGNNPNTGGNGLNKEPVSKSSIYTPAKADVNEVKDVFKKNKRVLRLLTPRKKRLKKKYTIA